jgi:poly(3-hydroxybutyrate) depolymerase
MEVSQALLYLNNGNSCFPRIGWPRPLRGQSVPRAVRVTRFAISLAAFAASIALCAGAALAAGSQCGPFGDPPEQARTGILARFVSNNSPQCFRGEMLGPWQDADGNDRYACLYEPDSVKQGGPVPMLVFLHPSLFSADTILMTNLRAAAETTDLGAGRPGFIILAVEGRDTSHYYIPPDNAGLGWDNWYRQFNPADDVTATGASYKENVDAATIDHFIGEQIATGRIDRKRIYVTGWSNGAAMAIIYTLNRPDIAAAAVYSAPDPFGAFSDPCKQSPVAHPAANDGEIQVLNPGVPIMHLRNSCDIAGICPNGFVLARQLRALGSQLDDVILDSAGKVVTECESACGTDPNAGHGLSAYNFVKAAVIHSTWPSKWTAKMLDFLKNHPHK